MAAGLYCDVGDLVQISHAPSGIDGYFYIQAVEKKLYGNNRLDYKWTLVQDFTH
jgi:hypothetical protein